MGSVWARLVCLQWLAVRITMSTLSTRASNEGYANANVIRDGHSVLNVKALVGAFNQERALVGAFSVILQLYRLIDLRH